MLIIIKVFQLLMNVKKTRGDNSSLSDGLTSVSPVKGDESVSCSQSNETAPSLCQTQELQVFLLNQIFIHVLFCTSLYFLFLFLLFYSCVLYLSWFILTSKVYVTR